MFTISSRGYTFAGVFATPKGGVLLGDPNVAHGAFYLVNRHDLPTQGAWYVWVKRISDKSLDVLIYHGSVKAALEWAAETICSLPLRTSSETLCLISAAALAKEDEWLHSTTSWMRMCQQPEGRPLLVSPFGVFIGGADRIVGLGWGARRETGQVCGIRMQVQLK